MLKPKKNQSHIHTFIKGSAISFIGVGVLGIVNYFIRRTLALNLSTVDFGFLYSAMSLCMIFLSYLDLGLGQSATILLAKSNSEGNIKRSNSIYTIFLGVKFLCALAVFLVLTFTYKFWLYDFFKYNNPLPYFVITTILLANAIVSAPYAVFSALKHFALLNIFQILGPLIILSVLLVINLHNELLVAAIIFPLSGFVIFIILSIVIVKFGFIPKYKYLKDTETLKAIFHLSKWVAISTAGLSTMYYLDSLMITYFRTLEEVALYNVALPIMQIAQSLIVIPGVFIPIVSTIWQKGKINEIANICVLVTEFFFYLLWPAVFTIILLSKYLIVFLFSAKFTEASTALIILFVGNIFFSLASFYMGTLNAGNNAKSVTVSIFLGNIINIVLNIVLVPTFGITGAAYATALSYLSILVFLTLKMRSTLEISFQIGKSKKLLLGTLIGVIGIIITMQVQSCSFKICMGVTIVLNLLYFISTYMKLKEYFLLFKAFILR